MKNDPVLQRRFDQRPRAQPGAIQFGIDVFQCFHFHFQSEGDFQCCFTRTRALQVDFIGVAIDPDEDLRERDVLLGIEILRQLLITEHLIAHQNALARVNPAEPAARQGAAAHRHTLRAVIFQKNQIVVAKRQQPVARTKAFQHHVRLAVITERDRFQGRCVTLVDGGIGFLARIQLVDDVDRLRRHPELRHKGVKLDDLLLLQAGLRNQIVKLDAQHDLAIRAQLDAEFLRHRR